MTPRRRPGSIEQERRRPFRITSGGSGTFYGQEFVDHATGKGKRQPFRRLRRWYMRNWMDCWWYTGLAALAAGAAWAIVNRPHQ